MDPVTISQLIYRLCISNEDKFDLALLLENLKDVIRINVKPGDICVATTKSMLTNLGLQFSEVTVPPGNDYVCGLIVSKSRILIRQFQTANNIGDDETLIKLFGYCLEFPMDMPEKGTDNHKALSAICKIVPALYIPLRKEIKYA